MHECEKFQNLIPEYIDGTISKADEVRLTEHLEECPHCQKELEFTRNVMKSLKEIPSAPLPEQFHAELRRKLEIIGTPSKKTLLHYLPKYSFAVSAVAAFALMVMAYHGNWKPAEQQPSDVESLKTVSPVMQETQPDIAKDIVNTSPSSDHIFAANETQTVKPQQTSAPSNNSGKISQTTKPKSPVAPSSGNQKVASPSQNQTPSSGGGSGGGGSASHVTHQETNGATQRKTQGVIFVVHSTVSQKTLDLLYDLPTCQAVDANYYQLSRSYQNKLIELLKECEYSIHFASEASRVDDSAIIIELIS